MRLGGLDLPKKTRFKENSFLNTGGMRHSGLFGSAVVGVELHFQVKEGSGFFERMMREEGSGDRND
ncbi:MAG: hypothetical protein ACP5XB_31710 [Isosphaeraceae bacterium]